MADITFGQAVVVGVVSGGFPAIVSAVAAIVISRLNRAQYKVDDAVRNARKAKISSARSWRPTPKRRSRWMAAFIR